MILLMFVFEGEGLPQPTVFFPEGKLFIVLNDTFYLHEKIQSIFFFLIQTTEIVLNAWNRCF